MQISGSIRCWRITPAASVWAIAVIRNGSIEADVFEIHRKVVDPSWRWRAPIGELSALRHGAHQRGAGSAVRATWQPAIYISAPLGLRNDAPFAIQPRRRPLAQPA